MSKFNLDEFPKSETGKQMFHRVSPIYSDSYVAKWLYEVMGMELDDVKKRFAEMREQVFTSTVTWGIEYQEHKFSIEPDDSLSLEERRARLYRKKTNKFPLNPKRIEQYLKNAWGLNVEVDETVEPGYIDLSFENKGGYDIVSAIKDFVKIKPSHLSISLSLKLKENVNLYTGGIVLDSDIYRLSEAPLPDTGNTNLYMGLVTDDIPDGISVGMLSQADVPLVLGLAQSAMFNRIGPANFTPIGPEDLQLALRQYHGGYFDGDDIHRITSKSTMDFLHSGNYFGGVVFTEDGRITPSVACPADVHPAVAVFFTPKLKRIGCDMSDVDKMAEASYMPPTGCTSTKLNITAITELAADNIGPRAVLREATEPVDIGLILQVPSCRIAAWEGDYERKDE